MVKAILNLNIKPYRMLKKSDAAEYCGVSASKLEHTIPPVLMPDGSKQWDVLDLNHWIDTLKTGDADSDDAILARLG